MEDENNGLVVFVTWSRLRSRDNLFAFFYCSTEIHIFFGQNRDSYFFGQKTEIYIKKGKALKARGQLQKPNNR